jgi:hypothetical protein
MRVNIAVNCVKPNQIKSNYIKHSFNKQPSSTDGHTLKGYMTLPILFPQLNKI